MRPFCSSPGTFLILILGLILRASVGVYASVLPQSIIYAEQQTQLLPVVDGESQDVVDGSIKTPPRLRALLNALDLMQDTYFDVFSGTWPSAIDWTAAVLGTHVSATLSSLVSSLKGSNLSCSDRLAWENIIAKYFAQISIFYFGENAFGLRHQAYDDMLWVVLGWLESIKFMKMYSLGYWEANSASKIAGRWHGMQFSPTAAHRARIFYDLASHGWDTTLCEGGMNWNPALTPYKNAITNELYISASISMYLYFPGDNNTSPYFVDNPGDNDVGTPHDPVYLENAIKAYKWLQQSKMQSQDGLYQDGFHISGWRRYANGTIDHGSRHCDVLNSMVYTYNQGVLLTASRGLWMATGARSYLDEGHVLVDSVIKATGWPSQGIMWQGLGRGGILEEFCDHSGCCSQDGQTFKGIFFNHLAEFCRPLWGYEEDFVSAMIQAGLDQDVYHYHKTRCAAYGAWIARNADAASVTKDTTGLFGMWWGREYPDTEPIDDIAPQTKLPLRAVDHMNNGAASWDGIWGHYARFDGRSVSDDNYHDVNDRGRGRSVETQSGGLAVLRADWQWRSLLAEYY
jgi:Glycosyl hydrolase family 76